MTKTNNLIFIGLKIIAWLIFVGLSIEAGGLVVNFIFSLYKPEFVQNLYQKLDLTPMLDQSRSVFFSLYTSILIVAVLKAYLFYVVVVLVMGFDLSRPFSNFVLVRITRISYLSLAIGLLNYIGHQAARNFQLQGFNITPLDSFWEDSEAFVFMAAVVYIISAIFKKGLELQNENDLTV